MCTVRDWIEDDDSLSRPNDETIALHRDGSLSTQDLRYRDLVGKKLQEPLHFAFFQIMPTNVYDAISRAVKIFAALGGIAVVALLLVLFLGK